MKFSELPKSSYFVIVGPEASLILAKDIDGQVRYGSTWEQTQEIDIRPGTQVQQVQLKKHN